MHFTYTNNFFCNTKSMIKRENDIIKQSFLCFIHLNCIFVLLNFWWDWRDSFMYMYRNFGKEALYHRMFVFATVISWCFTFIDMDSTKNHLHILWIWNVSTDLYLPTFWNKIFDWNIISGLFTTIKLSISILNALN